ncbi:unnamed protein product [Cylicocyclus nassatus]|uniref:Uncharacterized protein n=1 Tax=Cylicocyclus nassatus TaxID=53992 RepID=A0AA36GHK5_CYLNA|nr:unnamed protein product [Cylicocyclus nassatus]
MIEQMKLLCMFLSVSSNSFGSVCGEDSRNRSKEDEEKIKKEPDSGDLPRLKDEAEDSGHEVKDEDQVDQDGNFKGTTEDPAHAKPGPSDQKDPNGEDKVDPPSKTERKADKKRKGKEKLTDKVKTPLDQKLADDENFTGIVKTELAKFLLGTEWALVSLLQFRSI